MNTGPVLLIAMLDKITRTLDFHTSALRLRAQRQQVLSSNIANADTPNYKARDFDFKAALGEASQPSASARAGQQLLTTRPGHIGATTQNGSQHLQTALLYRQSEQPSVDGNSVDLDRERANFADNALRYEASLRFINSGSRRLITAIRGE